MTTNSDDPQTDRSDPRPPLEIYVRAIEALRAQLKRQNHFSRVTRDFLDGREVPVLGIQTAPISRVQVRAYQTLLRGVEASNESILCLSETIDEKIRDCLTICRSVVETSVNIAFIAAGGETAAEEARRHSLRRSYEDLDTSLNIGGFRMSYRSSGLSDPVRIAEMQRVLEEATINLESRRKAWTDLSMPKRLAVVIDKLGTQIGGLLAHAYFYVYRDASEIIHGSVYGCLLAEGATMLDKVVAREDLVFRVLFACTVCQNRAIWAIGRAHQVTKLVESAEAYDALLGDNPVFGELLMSDKSTPAPPSTT
jgi:hypothetical protein